VPQWFDYTDTPSHIPDDAKVSRFEKEYGNIDSPPSLPSVGSMRRIGRKYAQKLSLHQRKSNAQSKRMGRQGQTKTQPRRKRQAGARETAAKAPVVQARATIKTTKQPAGRRATAPKPTLDAISSLNLSSPGPVPVRKAPRGPRAAGPKEHATGPKQPSVADLPAKSRKRERYTATARPYGGMWRRAMHQAQKQSAEQGARNTATKFPNLAGFAYKG